MHDNRLLDLLKVLNKKEVQKLYDYIDSPFFAKSEDCVRFFTLIKSYWGKWDSPNWKKEKIFAKVFPKTDYTSARFNKLCFDALDLVEKFYIFYHLNEEDVTHYDGLLNLYVAERLPRLHESLMKSLKNNLEKQPLRNVDYLYQSFLLANKHTQFTIGFTQERIEKDSTHYLDYAESLTVFYIAKKLEITCLAVNNQKTNSNYGKDMIEDSEYLISTYQKYAYLFENYPFLKIYYRVFLLLKEIEPQKQVDELVPLLIEHESVFSKVDLLNLYGHVQNFYTRQINSGNAKAERDIFYTYKNMIRLCLLEDYKGNINVSTFKNIVFIALRLGEVNWAKDFIEGQVNFLPEELREDVRNYSYALLAFTEKDYKQTLYYLHNLEPVDIFFNLSVRRLQIQTYFELQDWEVMQSAINTFRVFIHREKLLSERQKESYRNFCTYTLKAADIFYEPQKLNILQIELQQVSIMTEKKWLLAKVDNWLKNKISQT